MKKIEVHVPNKSYNGYIGEIRFENGVGVFTDIELAKRVAEEFNGEIVGDITEKPKAEKAEEPKKRPRKKVEPKAGE